MQQRRAIPALGSSREARREGPLTAHRQPRLPAPYRFRHGDYDIAVVSDGHLLLPTSLLATHEVGDGRDVVLRAGGLTGIEYEPAANIVLMRRGAEVALFDTGGTGFQPHLGQLERHLAQAGIDVRDITRVVFTHGHPDHIWSTVRSDGSLRFPNASYFAGAAEWDFWNGEAVWTRLPAAQHPFVTGARHQYAAVRDRVTMIHPGAEVLPGVRALATPGHTPGHLSFEVEGGDGLIVAGDALTEPSVFFAHPEWTFGFDFDDAQAVASRKRLLSRAASEHSKLIGYHWPYPGVGRAERDGAGYRYVPIEQSRPGDRESAV